MTGFADVPFAQIKNKPTTLAGYGVTDVLVGNSNTIGWSDVIFAKDQANVAAQRNSGNAQLMRIYGSYTNASNYRRLKIGANNNTGTFEIRAEGLGTGVNNNKLDIICGTTGAVSAGNFTFYDATLDSYSSLTLVNGYLRLAGSKIEAWTWTKSVSGDGVSFTSIDSEGEDDGEGNISYKPTISIACNNTTGLTLTRQLQGQSVETVLAYNVNSDQWTIGNVNGFRDTLGLGTQSSPQFGDVNLYDVTADAYTRIYTDAGLLKFGSAAAVPFNQISLADQTSAVNTAISVDNGNFLVDGNALQKSITSGTAAPTGGNDGDIYLQYLP